MTNGRPRRIEAVVFDAMFTLIQPKGTRAELNARVLESVTGIAMDPAQLSERILQLRRLHPRDRSMRMEDYWPHINAQLIRNIASGAYTDERALRMGRRMHEQTLTDTALYEVRPAMREILAWLASVTTIAIASNQKQRALIQHLRASGIERQFGPHVYTSERLGSPKPSRHFWRAVLRGIGATSYSAMAYIGNSVESDIELALRERAPVALLDLHRGIAGLAVAGVSVVHDEVELRAWLERLLQRHAVSDAGDCDGACGREAVGE